ALSRSTGGRWLWVSIPLSTGSCLSTFIGSLPALQQLEQRQLVQLEVGLLAGLQGHLVVVQVDAGAGIVELRQLAVELLVDQRNLRVAVAQQAQGVLPTAQFGDAAQQLAMGQAELVQGIDDMVVPR